jgi:hypothetical protein
MEIRKKKGIISHRRTTGLYIVRGSTLYIFLFSVSLSHFIISFYIKSRKGKREKEREGRRERKRVRERREEGGRGRHEERERASVQAQAARRRTNLDHVAHAAHLALVAGVVLGAVIGARRRRRAVVDGRVRRGAHVELGELVVLDVELVVRVALAARLDRTCLEREKEKRKSFKSAIKTASKLFEKKNGWMMDGK